MVGRARGGSSATGLPRAVRGLAQLLLDVGCGTGAFAAEVAGLGCVTAVDLSPEAIAFSHRRSLDGLCVRSSHDVLRGFPDAVRLAVPPGTR